MGAGCGARSCLRTGLERAAPNRKSMNRAEYLTQPLPHEAHLLRLFDRAAPLTIFDVGACEAEDSIRYSRLFPNACIYAFEPLPDNVALARASLVRHGAGNVRLIETALSDRAGELEF